MLRQDKILQVMNQTDRYQKGKNKNIIGLTKDELDEKIIEKIAALRAKTYSYLTGKKDEDKKAKGIKKCLIKRKLKFKDYRSCLKATQF